MRRLFRPFIVLAALVILVETWLWERIGPLLWRLVALLPFARLKQALHDWLTRLSPYATLAVFIVPVVILIPFKLAGLALIARDHFILGFGVFFLAKVVGVGLEAFLFEACKPKLLEIPTFVRLYDMWNRWVVWAHELIDPVKRRLQACTRVIRGGRGSRAFRLLLRFRRIRRERAHLAGATGGT